jgi:hypothetical protein
MKKALLIIFLLGFGMLHAQDLSTEFYNLNRSGMLVLGGWALANIGISGTASFFSLKPEFHHMNAMWNLVNLGIAGFGYLTLQPDLTTMPGLMDAYLFNAGLDVAYIVGGFLLMELSNRFPERSDQLIGFGKSVILQGSFLFIFDLVMYFTNNNLA